MKKEVALIFLMMFFSLNMFSQKLYAWCPKEQIFFPRNGFLENKNIDLIILDARVGTENSRFNCSSRVIMGDLAELIRKTYTSPNIELLTSENYHKDLQDNKVTIKVAILAYHAAFGRDVKSGIGNVGENFILGVVPDDKWNAVTAYSVSIYDYSDGKEINTTRHIVKTSSKVNGDGTKIVAKNLLDAAYTKANKELIFFIDDTFIQ